MINVLIADDSELMRTVLRDLLARDDEIQIVAEARDGQTAVDLVKRLQPDLVIMDVLMPIMNGLDATCEIMADCPTPILILSANTDSGDNLCAFSAIRLGALDVMEKPAGLVTEAFSEIAEQLIRKVKSLCRIKVIHHFRTSKRPAAVNLITTVHPRRLLAIGASTGGPQAVLHLLRELPQHLPASVLLVQHIARGFASGFAGWLNRETPLRVQLARDGDTLLPGRVLVAPNDLHLAIVGQKVVLTETPPVHNCRPAVDVLFQSLADDGLAKDTVALLLTGMGQDGAKGLGQLRRKGALTLAQDEESSAIFGMPRVAIDQGAVSQVVSLADLPAVVKAQFEKQ